jgi:RNA polymerase sigma factor (sigma-70 family)
MLLWYFLKIDIMSDKLTETQKQLITDNYRLLYSFIRKIMGEQKIPRHLEDEFISDTFFKFCISALTYDKDHGCKFSTYAYGGFNLGLKRLLCHKRINFEKLYYSQKIEEYNLASEKEVEVASEDLSSFIDKVNISIKDKRILKDYYYKELTLKEVGLKYNVSHEAIRLNIKKTLKKIKSEANRKKIIMEDFYK